MFEESNDFKVRAEPIRIDKTPSTTKLGVEIVSVDHYDKVQKVDTMIPASKIHSVMPSLIAELMYGYFKTDLIDDGSDIPEAHSNAKMFVKRMLANKDFGMTDDEIDELLNTHLDEKLEDSSDEEA